MPAGHETRISCFSRITSHATRITAFTALRFTVGAKEMQHKTENRRKGPPRPPTSHCLPVWNFPLFPGKKNVPEPVSTHCPTFSVGFTASAVSWEFPGLCGEPGVRGRPSEPHRPPPSHSSPAQNCPELLGIARQEISPLSQCPRTALRSQSASQRTPMNPC